MEAEALIDTQRDNARAHCRAGVGGTGREVCPFRTARTPKSTLSLLTFSVIRVALPASAACDHSYSPVARQTTW